MRSFGNRIGELEPSAVTAVLWLVLVLTWPASALMQVQLLCNCDLDFLGGSMRELGRASAKRHQPPEHEPHLAHLFRCTLLYVRSTS